MGSNTVTMAALEHVLLELGYVKRVVANSHLRFKPSEQQRGVILLPLFKADEVVPSIDLLMTEVTVDNWGIADRKHSSACCRKASSRKLQRIRSR